MNAKGLDWSDLEVFLATAREGSLSGAARRLRVNASTVQRRMSRLEEALETRVFERSPRGYALTPVGEELLRHALGMETHAIAASRGVVGRDQSLEGVVTVDDVAFVVLPPILRAFREAHPKVEVHVYVASGFADLTRRQADVAIRFGARPSDADLVARRVAPGHVALYASEAYVAAHGRPERPEMLAAHDIVRGDESMARLGMERFVEQHADPRRTAFRSNSMLARLHAVKSGLGIGFLATFVAEPEPDLVRLDVETSSLSGELWIVVHVDLKRNARVRAFVDFVYPRMRDDPRWAAVSG